MNSLAQGLQALLRFAIVGVLVVVAIAGLFVAWWVVVFAVFALSFYLAVRRFFGAPVWGAGAPPAGPAGTVVIEGEYQVEREGERMGGRVIEVIRDDSPPESGDKNKA